VPWCRAAAHYRARGARGGTRARAFAQPGAAERSAQGLTAPTQNFRGGTFNGFVPSFVVTFVPG